MTCIRPLVLVLVVTSLTAVYSLPPGSTTARSATQIGQTVKQLSNQLMEMNGTSPDVITLDTRTPPKIKQQTKKKNKPAEMENSHAGVAIPLNEDDVIIEETNKKLNFYKIEKPTTNSGLSTWILLSGQASSTVKPSRKPIVKPNENQNATLLLEPNKIIKPIFKKRVTTIKPSTSTSTITTTKQNKIKATILTNATSKKVPTTTRTPSTIKKFNSTTTTSLPTTTSSTTTTIASTSINATTIIESSTIAAEAKIGETDLSEEKKTRRPSNKRKKNKNRRRRPSEKSDSTKIEKQTKIKENPIGTQLYNYLSREVMPTVGVGLVGLMVTAGLASYFLYPFGVARRSYEIDRKDKNPHYYYNDEYSGGIAEEEAIGKVIAGMPSNSLHGNTFKTPTSRHSFNNFRNRKVDQQKFSPKPDHYQSIVYENQDIVEQNKETGYTVDDKKFVVGNVPEDVTPAAVPEHGPRSFNLRKKRDSSNNINDGENEIESNFSNTTPNIVTTSTISTITTEKPISSLVRIFKNLFHLKVNLGLQLLQNATQAISKYVSHVQKRLDQHYKNYTMTYKH